MSWSAMLRIYRQEHFIAARVCNNKLVKVLCSEGPDERVLMNPPHELFHSLNVLRILVIVSAVPQHYPLSELPVHLIRVLKLNGRKTTSNKDLP